MAYRRIMSYIVFSSKSDMDNFMSNVKNTINNYSFDYKVTDKVPTSQGNYKSVINVFSASSTEVEKVWSKIKNEIEKFSIIEKTASIHDCPHADPGDPDSYDCVPSESKSNFESL